MQFSICVGWQKMSDKQEDREKKGASVEPGSGAESVGGSSSEGSLEHSPPELESTDKPNEGELIPVPPPTPKGGVSILAHKIWIGNLDKRLTE